MNKLERTKNTIRNIGMGVFDKITMILLPFMLRTVVIYTLGIEYVGLNGLFTSILQVLNLSELGFSSAVVYSMYKPIAENNEELICALLSYYRKIYRIIGTVILSLGMMIMPFLKLFIKGTYPQELNIYIIYFLFLINTCISYFFMGYKAAILNAYQRMDVLSTVSMVVNSIMYFMQIGILLLTGNYYIYILLMPIFTILNNVVTSFEVNRRFPRYKCSGNLSNDMKLNLKKDVVGIMIQKLCATTRNSFDNIFVSAFLGLTFAAMYSNYYYIMASVISVSGIIIQSMLAGVGNSIQTESKEQNYNDLKRFNFMYMWISGWCMTCLLCLYQPFMELWVGTEHMFPMSVVVLFCIYFYVLKMGDMQSIYYIGAGLWWKGKWRALLESAGNLILNIILVKCWGIHGVIVGTLISLFLFNFIYGERLLFKHFFKNNKELEFYMLQIKYMVISIVISSITYGLCTKVSLFLNLNIFYQLCIRAGICIVLPNVCYFLFYHRMKEYVDAKNWLKGKFINGK